ncbi:MAG: hypothetical protein WAU86_20975 [Oricola sp.]
MADTSRQEELKRQRDELLLQLHLASMEAKEEWEELMTDWDRFASKTQLSKSADEVGEAARQLGLKMKDAFDRFRKGV